MLPTSQDPAAPAANRHLLRRCDSGAHAGRSSRAGGRRHRQGRPHPSAPGLDPAGRTGASGDAAAAPRGLRGPHRADRRRGSPDPGDAARRGTARRNRGDAAHRPNRGRLASTAHRRTPTAADQTGQRRAGCRDRQRGRWRLEILSGSPTWEASTILFAHETWFDHGVYPTDWGFTAEPLTLAFLVAALPVTIAVRLVARIFPGVDVPALGRLAPFMPFAIRLHLAVSTAGSSRSASTCRPQWT